MELRPRHHNKVYYKALNSNLPSIIALKKAKYTPFQIKTKPTTELKDFVKTMNLLIVKQLKFGRKSITTTGYIDISSRLHNFFKNNYKITGRFSNNVKFNEDFGDLIKTRSFETVNQINRSSVSDLVLKIRKKKSFHYNDENCKNQILDQKPVFTFRFLREQTVIAIAPVVFF